MKRSVVLLGSTGSIGTQALDVIADNSGSFEVVGLAAGGSDPELLAQQALATGAQYVAVPDKAAGARVGDELSRLRVDRYLGESDRRKPEVWAGPDAVTDLAGLGTEIVLNAIAGAAGLPATLRALASGALLALANKESLVIGGRMVTGRARPGQLIPVDSEHSAIAQCLRAGDSNEVDRLVLTASGGPFRGWLADQLRTVTPAQALAHPTWDMGPVVTINSATLVNKGLELIEAHLLFDVPLERIDVVVHPESIVHSMVTFIDGATIAQASPPDMRLPIALALGWPDRVRSRAVACDWTRPAKWHFEPVDELTFPAVQLARRVGLAAGSAPAVFNAANEVCVAAFLAGRISFPDIVVIVEQVVAEHVYGHEHSIDSEFANLGETEVGYVIDDDLSLGSLNAADGWARAAANARCDASGDASGMASGMASGVASGVESTGTRQC